MFPAKAFPAAGLASFTTASGPSRETKTSGSPARPRGARPRAAGVEKRLEQRFLLPFRDEVLGVPLHGGAEAAAGPLERLDEVVRRRRQRHEARREVLHALVVARVHGRAFERGDGRREARGRGRRPRPHDVRGMVLSGVRIRVRVVRNAARPLRRQVLPQRASERDVQRLKPAADAEDRRAELFRGGKKREVERIPLGMELESRRRGRLAVERWRHVGAACEQQPVERAGVRVARSHDDDLFGQGSRREQGAAIRRVWLFRVGRDDDLHGRLKEAFRAGDAAREAGRAIIETTWGPCRGSS